jgi:hypothetical protein
MEANLPTSRFAIVRFESASGHEQIIDWDASLEESCFLPAASPLDVDSASCPLLGKACDQRKSPNETDEARPA